MIKTPGFCSAHGAFERTISIIDLAFGQQGPSCPSCAKVEKARQMQASFEKSLDNLYAQMGQVIAGYQTQIQALQAINDQASEKVLRLRMLLLGVVESCAECRQMPPRHRCLRCRAIVHELEGMVR